MKYSIINDKGWGGLRKKKVAQHETQDFSS